MNNLFIIDNNIKFIKSIKTKLKQRFKIIDLNFAQYYLNIEIIRNDNIIFLKQTIYLRKILKRFDIKKYKIANTLIKSNFANVIMLTKNEQQINSNILY